jgi:hypothetical protein
VCSSDLYVLQTPQQAAELPLLADAVLVAQTTFSTAQPTLTSFLIPASISKIKSVFFSHRAIYAQALKQAYRLPGSGLPAQQQLRLHHALPRLRLMRAHSPATGAFSSESQSAPGLEEESGCDGRNRAPHHVAGKRGLAATLSFHPFSRGREQSPDFLRGCRCICSSTSSLPGSRPRV